MKALQRLQQPALKSVPVHDAKAPSTTHEPSPSVLLLTGDDFWTTVQRETKTSFPEWWSKLKSALDSLDYLDLQGTPFDNTACFLGNEQTTSVLYFRYHIGPVIDLLNKWLEASQLAGRYRFTWTAEYTPENSRLRIDYTIELLKLYREVLAAIDKNLDEDNQEEKRVRQGFGAASPDTGEIRPSRLEPGFQPIKPLKPIEKPWLQERKIGIAFHVEMKQSLHMRFWNIFRAFRTVGIRTKDFRDNHNAKSVMPQLTAYAKKTKAPVHFVSTFRETFGCIFTEFSGHDINVDYFACEEGTDTDARVEMFFHGWKYAVENIDELRHVRV